MLRKASPLAVSLLLFLLTVTPAAAITWGKPDNEDHPQVVALLFQRSDGFYSCSGTLLTPYLVLTAGHCTEDGGVVNLATWVTNVSEISFADRDPTVPVVDYLNDSSTWHEGTAVPHPDYNDFADFPNTYDVGLVLLDEPIYVDAYGELPSLGQFDSLATQLGRQAPFFTVVGYGIQAIVPIAFPQDEFTRYQGNSRLTNSSSANTGGVNFQFTNSPGKGHGSGGTCSGDSGGPFFYQDTLIVAAINSFGIAPNCTGTDYGYRTDIALTLDFVTPYLSWEP